MTSDLMCVWTVLAAPTLLTMAAAHVALDVSARAADSRGVPRFGWALAGALCLALAAYAGHSVMSSLSGPPDGSISAGIRMGALIVTIIVSGLALWTVNHANRSLPRTAAAGMLLGVCISVIHFGDNLARGVPLAPAWSWPDALTALGLASLSCAVGMRLAVRCDAGRPFGRILGAAYLAVGLVGQHVLSERSAPFEGLGLESGALLWMRTNGILAMALVVVPLAALTAAIDRRWASRSEELSRTEQRYRLLFSRSLAGVYQSTLDGRLLDCNLSLARILGYPNREACLAVDAREFYPEASSRDEFIERLRVDGTLPAFESVLKRADGREVWVLDCAALAPGRAGDPPIIEGTIIDITEQKLLQQEVEAKTAELVNAVERYSALVQSTSAMPWEADAETLTMTFLAPQSEALVGRSAESLTGSCYLDIVHPDDVELVRREVTESAARHDHDRRALDHRLITADGDTRYVRTFISVEDGRGSGAGAVRAVTLDMTAEAKLQLELRQAQKLESVGRLAAGVAHEINTPVQFVSDSVHFVQEGVRDLTHLIELYRATVAPGVDADEAAARRTEAEEAADLPYLLANMPKAVARALEGLGRVAVIVRSMKEFAHPDQREMTLVDLNRSIESTLVIARNEYKYVADVELDLGDVPAVLCHGGDVNQALLNVLVNAAHAIGDKVKGTQERGRIHVSTRQDGDAVVIAIGDTGMGIPEAVQQRMFDPFFTTKEVGRGTGQGLAISRSIIVDRHGGELTFQTEQGVGTTFFLRLPIDPGPQGGSEGPAIRPVEAAG